MAATEPVLTYDTNTFDVFMSPEEMYQMGKFKEAVALMNHYFRLFPFLSTPCLNHCFLTSHSFATLVVLLKKLRALSCMSL